VQACRARADETTQADALHTFFPHFSQRVRRDDGNKCSPRRGGPSYPNRPAGAPTARVGTAIKWVRRTDRADISCWSGRGRDPSRCRQAVDEFTAEKVRRKFYKSAQVNAGLSHHARTYVEIVDGTDPESSERPVPNPCVFVHI
jgi:hypothetical protein